MHVTLSEARLTTIVKELEGINDNLDEITHRMDRYAARLFTHVANYGVRMASLMHHSGSLGTFDFRLDPCWDDESRSTRLRGLAMMNPVSVTVTQGDLPAFFLGMALAAMSNAWSTYAHKLERLSVQELGNALQEIGMQVVFAPAPQPSNEVEAILHQNEFEVFLAQSGKRDPLARFRAADELRRQEEAAIVQRKEAALDHFIHGE